MMEALLDDVRHAARRLRKSPGFTFGALATLALGIGANTALFSVVYGVLLRPLPFTDPDRLYQVWSRHTSTDRYPFQLPEFCDYRERTATLEGVAGLANWNANLTGDGPAERLTGLRVSGGFFDLLGTRALLGRTLRPSDDTPGDEKVIVLSHGLWQRRFGADPDVVGRSLSLNGEPFTVVGVLDRQFLFPVRDVSLAIPLAPDTDPWRHNRASTNFIRIVARARPGVTQSQVEGDLEAIAARLKAEFPDSYNAKRGVLVVPFRDELTRRFGQTLWMLLGAVGLLLVIACANLANLMLLRGTDRRRELAVRQALGASRARLARPLLAESGLLAVGGAGLGMVLAASFVPLLVAAAPAAMPGAADARLSLPVLLFTAGVALVAGLSFGVAPAFRAAQLDPNADLRSDGHRTAGAVERGRLSGLIVAGQTALMVVLLTGAGLLFRSLNEVMRVEPGFDPEVLTVRLSLPRRDYGQLPRVSQFYRQLEARVAALPGVLSVGAVNHVPLNGALASADYKIAGAPPVSDDRLPTAQYRMATPAFFETMGIPLLAGRAFSDDDREGTALVAVVNRALARQSFPGRDPVGKHLLVKDTPDGFRSMEIVGVVGDVRHGSLETAAEPHLYVPYHQTHRELLVWLALNQFLVVRTGVEPMGLAEAVRRELAAVDPSVAAADLRASGHYVEAASAGRRFSLGLLAGFAVLALLLAVIGIYGVVSYAVAKRTREIGLRRALGASTPDIAGMVLSEGVRRTALGLALGLLGAAATSHALRSLLYGVRPTDPWTYAAVSGVLAAVTLAACLVPARRAVRVDPLAALRSE